MSSSTPEELFERIEQQIQLVERLLEEQARNTDPSIDRLGERLDRLIKRLDSLIALARRYFPDRRPQ